MLTEKAEVPKKEPQNGARMENKSRGASKDKKNVVMKVENRRLR